jgi:hypothetical protein
MVCKRSRGGVGFVEEERNLPSSLGHGSERIRHAWGSAHGWSDTVGGDGGLGAWCQFLSGGDAVRIDAVGLGCLACMR